MRTVTLAAALLCLGLAAPATRADELYGTLKKIRDAGTIVIGHRESSPPFSYLDAQQKAVGYSMDLCMKVVEALKADLKLPGLQVKLVPVSSSTRIPLLANGTIDMECGSTTNTLSRQEQVDFAFTTYVTGTRLLVKAKSGIRELEDLKGKVIAASQGTTNEKVVRELVEKKGLGAKVVAVRDHAEGFLAVQTGRADAQALDDILLYGLIAKSKNPKDYAVVGRFLSFDPYAIMLRRDDSAFRVVVNRTLAGLFRSGEIDKIYARWLEPIGVPMGELLKSAIAIQSLPE